MAIIGITGEPSVPHPQERRDIDQQDKNTDDPFLKSIGQNCFLAFSQVEPCRAPIKR